MSDFEKLHPAVQHHIVNSIGWKSLRPLQEAAISPLLAGSHALLLAPTAGGKTEAALFPVISRMLAEDWRGLSVLYVCPIKALLNNLEVRLRRYTSLFGRSTRLWHGDVGQAERKRILGEPPDILLTTPESIEVMLVSSKTDASALFRNARVIIVDELHAFAGDDRGWHLLSVLERVSRLAASPLQRLGLSATIGNPEELLEWLVLDAPGERAVIAPPAEAGPEPEVELDYVGSLENAAKVISRLHRGDKRLVFCDSRSRVEQLAASLRDSDVETFVSHSSLSVDERRRAEGAFAEGANCVIVATETLELGIDVGDLDRVIQIDAPSTAAAFLQRLGRTGRRPGTSRNCLFLATGEDAFLRAAGLLHLWSQGYVEPVTPPVDPLHIAAQQLMALTLQETAVGRNTWLEWLGGLPAQAQLAKEDIQAVVEYMLSRGILHEDEGLLSIGVAGERAFGRRHFMELMSVFTSDPLFTVFHGRSELGHLHPLSLQVRRSEPAIVLLAGRSWRVTSVDWRQKRAYVEPAVGKGRSNWLGEGRALSFELCRSVRDVLSGTDPACRLTGRAQREFAALRDQYGWVSQEGTSLTVDTSGGTRWWTFAGLRANTTLAAALSSLAEGPGRAENLSVPLQGHASANSLTGQLSRPEAIRSVDVPIDEEALKGMKFNECLPPAIAARVFRSRMVDETHARECAQGPIRSVSL